MFQPADFGIDDYDKKEYSAAQIFDIIQGIEDYQIEHLCDMIDRYNETDYADYESKNDRLDACVSAIQYYVREFRLKSENKPRENAWLDLVHKSPI